MIQYAITDRKLFPGDQTQRIQALLRQSERWAQQGIHYIQLREKDLGLADRVLLARAILQILERTSPSACPPQLLINSRADVAVAIGAKGVHLTSGPGELTAPQIRQLYADAGLPSAVVSCSCHTLADVITARSQGADLILFGPVFGKTINGFVVVPGTGLAVFSEACRIASPVPVLALGGVARDDADACVGAGGAGIAGIRSFVDAGT